MRIALRALRLLDARTISLLESGPHGAVIENKRLARGPHAGISGCPGASGLDVQLAA